MLGIFKVILSQTLYLVSQFPINRLLFELLACRGCQEGQLSQTMAERNFSSQDAFTAYLGPQFPYLLTDPHLEGLIVFFKQQRPWKDPDSLEVFHLQT